MGSINKNILRAFSALSGTAGVPDVREALSAVSPPVPLPFLKTITSIATDLTSYTEGWPGSVSGKIALMRDGTVFAWAGRASPGRVALFRIATGKSFTELISVNTDFAHALLMRNPVTDQVHLFVAVGASYASSFQVYTYNSDGTAAGAPQPVPGDMCLNLSTSGAYFFGGIGEDGQVCLVSSVKAATGTSYSTANWQNQTLDFKKFIQWGSWDPAAQTWSWDKALRLGNGPRTAYDSVHIIHGRATIIAVNNSSSDDTGGPIAGYGGRSSSLYGMCQLMGFIHDRNTNEFRQVELTDEMKWRMPYNTVAAVTSADLPLQRMHTSMIANDGTIWLSYSLNKPQIYADPINGGSVLTSAISQVRVMRLATDLSIISDNNAPSLPASGYHSFYQLSGGRIFMLRMNNGASYSQFCVLDVTVNSDQTVTIQAPDNGALNNHTHGNCLNCADYPLVGSLGIGNSISTFSSGPLTAPYRAISFAPLLPERQYGSVMHENQITGLIQRYANDYPTNTDNTTGSKMELLEVVVPT